MRGYALWKAIETLPRLKFSCGKPGPCGLFRCGRKFIATKRPKQCSRKWRGEWAQREFPASVQPCGTPARTKARRLIAKFCDSSSSRHHCEETCELSSC